MLTLLSLLPLILGVMQCPSARDPGVEPHLACFLDQTPRCPADAEHCVGLHLHVAAGAEQDAKWMREEIEHADLVFGPAGVSFEVVAVDPIGPEFAIMQTREQRDAIGRKQFGLGVVHVFLVAQLDDVDVPGAQIRGVHWRQRSNPDKRWLILSQIGGKVLLSHELGHFFGLPHSRYVDSVMNKKPRESPTWEERVFVPEELEIVIHDRDEMLRTKALEERAGQQP